MLASGYLIYTSLAQAHNMSVERLAPDFLTSAAVDDPKQSSGLFGMTFVEAPAIFKASAGAMQLWASHSVCPEGGRVLRTVRSLLLLLRLWLRLGGVHSITPAGSLDAARPDWTLQQRNIHQRCAAELRVPSRDTHRCDFGCAVAWLT